jgi:hypothetical protein
LIFVKVPKLNSILCHIHQISRRHQILLKAKGLTFDSYLAANPDRYLDLAGQILRQEDFQGTRNGRLIQVKLQDEHYATSAILDLQISVENEDELGTHVTLSIILKCRITQCIDEIGVFGDMGVVDLPDFRYIIGREKLHPLSRVVLF